MCRRLLHHPLPRFRSLILVFGGLYVPSYRFRPVPFRRFVRPILSLGTPELSRNFVRPILSLETPPILPWNAGGLYVL